MKSKFKPLEIEIVNAGKKIIRTNIIPYYLPIDESKIVTVELPNAESEGIHTETIYPEQEIDYWTYNEKIEYNNCYTLLTPSDYLKLNEVISERLGFNLNESTERYTSLTSQFTTDGLMIMEITTEVQIKCADLLEGITLVDNGQWTIAEEQPTMIEATGLTIEQVDWTLAHTAITKPNIEVLYLLDGVPTNEQAIQDCVSEGITVIINQ